MVDIIILDFYHILTFIYPKHLPYLDIYYPRHLPYIDIYYSRHLPYLDIIIPDIYHILTFIIPDFYQIFTFIILDFYYILTRLLSQTFTCVHMCISLWDTFITGVYFVDTHCDIIAFLTGDHCYILEFKLSVIANHLFKREILHKVVHHRWQSNLALWYSVEFAETL